MDIHHSGRRNHPHKLPQLERVWWPEGTPENPEQTPPAPQDQEEEEAEQEETGQPPAAPEAQEPEPEPQEEEEKPPMATEEKPTERKIRVPVDYNGDCEEVTTWLNTCMIYLRINKRMYTNDEDKIILSCPT